MTNGDGSDVDAGANPPAEGENPPAEGGDQTTDWDKVAAIIRDTVGIDPDKVMAERAEEAATKARKDAGIQAQKTYDPKIDALEKKLQGLTTELTRTRQDARLADIAKMPAEKQEAAKKLLEAETNVRELGQMRQNLNEAAKAVAAERAALELQKEGITAEAEDFNDCSTPADMEAKAAKLRVTELERQLKEVKEGKGKDESEQDKSKPKPPEASRRPAPKTGGTGGAPGGKPWEEQKGKGLGSVAAALRAQREAE